MKKRLSEYRTASFIYRTITFVWATMPLARRTFNNATPDGREMVHTGVVPLGI